MRRGFNNEKELDNLYYVGNDGKTTVIDYLYRNGQLIWELIIGFLFGKDNTSLQSKDDCVLRAKDL